VCLQPSTEANGIYLGIELTPIITGGTGFSL